MKKVLTMAVAALIAVAAWPQKRVAVYAVGFYNLENLFDTCHDSGKNDHQFLPGGDYKWNAMKYAAKLRNMSRALADMGTDVLPAIGCAAIGVSEVENSRVLDDLTAQPPLKARGYKYAHVEGPDKRGVDCALLYNPALLSVERVSLPPYVPELEKDSGYVTRGFLTVEGRMAGDEVAIIVCHWPSRFAGSFYRESAARQVRTLKDSLLAARPGVKVMVMGDMNDDPTNRSMHDCLGAKAEAEEVAGGDMYNPWYDILAKEGRGTLMYNGAWNLFDQIVLSPSLVAREGEGCPTLKFWKNQIVKRDYLMQKEGKYKGSPKRTTAGGVWLNGFSDHLPVVVYLKKEMK